VTYSSGKLSTINLYNTIRSDGDINDYGSDIDAVLYATAVGNGSADFEWTSSNPKVAYVEKDGSNRATVWALSKGTATITCKATDGSGKKATVKIKVTIPASSIEVVSGAGRLTNGDFWDWPVIAYGKSVTNKALLGDTYGKPSTTKVTWDFTVEEVNSNLQTVRDLTTIAKNKKLVSVSSSGKLTVNSKLSSEKYNSYNELLITVTAKTTDGTNLEAGISYFVVTPTKTMRMENYITKYETLDDSGFFTFSFYCDQHRLFNNKQNCGFTVTSSNPKLGGVVTVVPDTRYTGWYFAEFYLTKPGNHGTTTVTITSADGAKNVKFSLRVR